MRGTGTAVPVERREHPVLADHVVRGRQDVAERRPAQDDLAGVGGDAVGEVRLAAGDQRDVALQPARVVQHVGEQRPDDLRVGAGRDALEALRRGVVEAAGRRRGHAAYRSATGVWDRRRSGRGRRGRRARGRAGARGAAASPNSLLAQDDAAQEAVRLVLLGEGDAAEHLQGAMGDLARAARDVGLGDRGRLLGVSELVVERRGGVEHGRPAARLRARTCRPGCGAGPGCCRSCGRTAGARRRSARASVEHPARPRRRTRRRRAARRRGQPREHRRRGVAAGDRRRSAPEKVTALHAGPPRRATACGSTSTPAASAATSASAGRAVDRRDDREAVDRVGVLDRDLLAASRPSAPAVVRRPSDRPAAPGLEQRDGHAVVAERERRAARRRGARARSARRRCRGTARRRGGRRARGRSGRARRRRGRPRGRSQSTPKSTSAFHSRSRSAWPASWARSAAGHSRSSSVSTRLAEPGLLVGQLEVHVLLLGQREDAVGDDVALDLLRAAVDGRRARVQVGLVPELVLDRLGGSACWSVGPSTSSAVAASRCSASAISSFTLELSGPDRAAVEELADGAVGVVAEHLDADRTPARARPATSGRRAAAARRARARRPRATARSSHVRSLTCRGSAAVPRSCPSVYIAIFQPSPRSPSRFSFGHHDVVEEQLAELGVAGDLRHRPHLDARRAHVDDQHRDAAVLRAGVVRAREHAAPARVLAPGDPRLLAAEDEVVVVLDRARAQRGEVGAGLGLGEALAPDLLGREDRRDVALAAARRCRSAAATGRGRRARRR